MGAIMSQINSLTIVYSIVYSDADQRKHQSSASLAFVRGIHRGPVNSPHKWPVTRKMFPFDDVITWYKARFINYTMIITNYSIKRYGIQWILEASQYKDAVYQYRNSHYSNKTVYRRFYLYNGNPISGNTGFMLKRALRWSHNGRDSVSNHQPHHCLLNRLFGCRSKKTSKLRITGLCVNSPHKWLVTRKMFPFDDVIMGTLVFRYGTPQRHSVSSMSISVLTDLSKMIRYL